MSVFKQFWMVAVLLFGTGGFSRPLDVDLILSNAENMFSLISMMKENYVLEEDKKNDEFDKAIDSLKEHIGLLRKKGVYTELELRTLHRKIELAVGRINKLEVGHQVTQLALKSLGDLKRQLRLSKQLPIGGTEGRILVPANTALKDLRKGDTIFLSNRTELSPEIKSDTLKNSMGEGLVDIDSGTINCSITYRRVQKKHIVGTHVGFKIEDVDVDKDLIRKNPILTARSSSGFRVIIYCLTLSNVFIKVGEVTDLLRFERTLDPEKDNVVVVK